MPPSGRGGNPHRKRCCRRGAAPTGSSVGMHEAFVLRDGDKSTYGGLSVHKAVEKVETIIAPALIGMDVFDQRAIDEKMIAIDGTPDKGALAATRYIRYRSRLSVLRPMRCAFRSMTTLRAVRSRLCLFLLQRHQWRKIRRFHPVLQRVPDRSLRYGQYRRFDRDGGYRFPGALARAHQTPRPQTAGR